MHRFLLATALLAVSSLAVSAAPLCTSSLGVDVNTLTLGCVAGPYLFDNFLWTDANGRGGGAVVITAAGPGGPVSSIDLVFGTSLGTPSSAFTQDLHFTFRVSTLNGTPGIYQTALSATGSGSGSHVAERGCTAVIDQDSGICAGAVLYDYTAFAGQTINITPNAGNVGVSELFVWKDLNSDIRGSLTSFTESFQTPEPMSISLLGAGLLGFGLIRKRRKA
ncbi:MAG: PEP-CTERM sorting domain-containing protein [Bryobacteraceae bacterium]